jgi:uncharacterized protein YyaL (SSP411 family)
LRTHLVLGFHRNELWGLEKISYSCTEKGLDREDDKFSPTGTASCRYFRGSQVLSDPKYAEIARKAADFILKEMRSPEGMLLHRYKEGAGIQANLDDYAFLVWGLIELYETLFDVRHLQEALKLSGLMLEHFWDDEMWASSHQMTERAFACSPEGDL